MANGESCKFGDKEREARPAHVCLDIPATRRQSLQRVPAHVREEKKHIYDPVIVSLGPYHHGRPQFREGETFKDEVLNIMLDSAGGGATDKCFQFRRKIVERVDEIRSFYGGVSEDEYEDEALAEMMLRDTCLVLYVMESQTENGHEKRIHIVRRLGMFRVGFIIQDLLMLENQIPLWAIKLLITLTSYDDESEPLLYKFLSYVRLGNHSLARVLWEDREKEAVHILDAIRASLFKSSGDPMKAKIKGHYPILEFSWQGRQSCKRSSYLEQIDSLFGSVIELKAKGIHFSVTSHCLTDLRFDSYLFYGKLQLPVCIVSHRAKVFLLNMIAFEMSPESDTDFAVTSYVGFMKSLIQNSEDVKELRKKGIIFSTLANDEEVVKIFKEIDGHDFYNIFHDVKQRINEHCNSKAKTWIAELIHTYFRSPWNTIALFAATLLLCLTFLQTYYSMYPISRTTN